MATTDIASIYTAALKNTHALENQGLQQMETQLKGLDHYPDYAAVLRAHVGTTREQIGRIDDALRAVGTGTSSLKEAVTGVAGTVGAAVHAMAPDETLKNLYAGYAFQYDQIAAYRSLIVIAEAAGHADHAALFQTSVEEEKTGAKAIDGIIESVTRQYLKLAAQGAKADS